MGILFLPARQGGCSGLLFCSAARPSLLLRLKPRPTPTTATAMAWVATLDTATLDSATLVVTTASVRLRLSPRLMLMLRLIPTTDTATPDLATDVDTDTLALATAVDTPPLDTPDSATLVATLDSATEATDTPVVTTASVRLRPSLRLMLRLRLIPTTDTDTLA